MKKPSKAKQKITMMPTPDGAGLSIKLRSPAAAEPIEWLAGELQKVIAYLDQAPQERPKEKTESPAYAAGLRDMAAWIQEIVEHEIDWQTLRHLVGNKFADQLPAHGSSVEVKEAGRP